MLLHHDLLRQQQKGTEYTFSLEVANKSAAVFITPVALLHRHLKTACWGKYRFPKSSKAFLAPSAIQNDANTWPVLITDIPSRLIGLLIFKIASLKYLDHTHNHLQAPTATWGMLDICVHSEYIVIFGLLRGFSPKNESGPNQSCYISVQELVWVSEKPDCAREWSFEGVCITSRSVMGYCTLSQGKLLHEYAWQNALIDMHMRRDTKVC